MPDFSNPRCYAQKTNKCSESISREHIISNNILEIFEHNKGVKIAGLPWMEHERFNLMSRNARFQNALNASARRKLLIMALGCEGAFTEQPILIGGG